MAWRDLLAYWRSKHVGNLPPSRASLDPVSEIPRLVRSLILIDCGVEGYRFRLVGSEVVARAGGDGTGRLVSSAPYPRAVLDAWIASLDGAARDHEAQLMRSHLQGGGAVLTLLLPLVAADGSTEMILGGAFPDGSTEGLWQPISIEHLDIQAQFGAASGVDFARSNGTLVPTWSTRFQT